MTGQVPRLRRLVLFTVAFGLLMAIALGSAGQLARDRSIAWALLMYLPLVPLGLAAMAFDALLREIVVDPEDKQPLWYFEVRTTGPLACCLAQQDLRQAGPRRSPAFTPLAPAALGPL